MKKEHSKNRPKKKVAFVANCLINQNAKVYGFALCSGIVTPVVDMLKRDDCVIQQLPCPELTFSGIDRWWSAKEQYDTPGYRHHCYNLATIVVDQMEQYVKRGYEVVIVGLDGSPSSGVRATGSSPGWGGRPQGSKEDFKIIPGMGVWMEELYKEIEKRGLRRPKGTGIAMDTPTFKMEPAVKELSEFLKS